MTATAKHRGHLIQYINGKWKFVEGPQRGKYGKERPCAKCHGVSKTYDVCLGKLAGVMAACCGHGCVHDAYIMFENGEGLRGEDVWRLRDIWRSSCLQPGEVIEVYLHVKDLDTTRRLCEL